MTEPADLESRVTALENEVHDLSERVRHSEHGAAAARVLAGGADRDVAEIRTEIRDFKEQNTRVLNAMREDLSDLRRDMTDLRQHVDNGFRQVGNQFQQVDRGFAEMRVRLDATAAGQEQIVGLLNTLIDQQGGAQATDR